MNFDGPVGGLCVTLWKHRGALTIHRATKTARLLAVAVADEVNASETYDPLEDRRALWAWDVLGSALRGEKPAQASEVLEDFMVWATGGHQEPVMSGKELAAGGDR